MKQAGGRIELFVRSAETKFQDEMLRCERLHAGALEGEF